MCEIKYFSDSKWFFSFVQRIINQLTDDQAKSKNMLIDSLIVVLLLAKNKFGASAYRGVSLCYHDVTNPISSLVTWEAISQAILQ